jgi:hypothetical protein
VPTLFTARLIAPTVNLVLFKFLNISWPFPGNVSTILILLYLFAQTGRLIGKAVFEKKETEMLTTYLLLYSNRNLTASLKNKIRSKLISDFGLQLFGPSRELEDADGAKKSAAEAVALIREKVKDGRLILQYNIEYGFARNLIGCACIALVFSALNTIMFWHRDNQFVTINVILFIIYLLPIVLSKVILNYLGRLYANRLIMEYINS